MFVPTQFPGVSVSSDGMIQMANGRRTWGYINPQRGPYLRCNVGQSARLVHRLVAETLVPNKNRALLNVVHHADYDIYNNSASNLVWVNTQLNTMMRENARGCYFNKRSKTWNAACICQGKQYKLGKFSTFLEGHRAHKAFRDKKFHEVLKKLENEAWPA